MSESSIKWSAMEPHEKNACIAEKVFGRKIYRHNTWGQWLLYHETKPGLTEAIPDYTRNLNDAWLVIEHFFRLERSESEAHFLTKMERRKQFMERFTLAHLWSKPAKEASEAICLAGLEVMEVNIE